MRGNGPQTMSVTLVSDLDLRAQLWRAKLTTDSHGLGTGLSIRAEDVGENSTTLVPLDDLTRLVREQDSRFVGLGQCDIGSDGLGFVSESRHLLNGRGAGLRGAFVRDRSVFLGLSGDLTSGDVKAELDSDVGPGSELLGSLLNEWSDPTDTGRLTDEPDDVDV